MENSDWSILGFFLSNFLPTSKKYLNLPIYRLLKKLLQKVLAYEIYGAAIFLERKNKKMKMVNSCLFFVDDGIKN